jgi:Family of unknown function (DUF6298)
VAGWKTVAVTIVTATGLLRAQTLTPPGLTLPIDFSYAGYGGGGRAIPDVRATIAVAPADGDDGFRIQAAIDRVSAMPVNADGFRGAVLLESGHFDVASSIRLETSGVVLRGAGRGPQESVLVATGVSRRALVMVVGRSVPSETPGSSRPILDAHVPTGSPTIHVADPSGFHAGDRVVITRPSTKSWIARLGMDAFEGWRPENRLHWQAGSRDIAWHRRVTAIDGSTLRLDAPLTTALDANDGGATIARYEAGGIDHVGLENLRLESTFDASHPGDEDHAWTGVALDRVEDAWVRQATLQHFAGTAVDVRAGARSVTVEDVEVLDPIAEDANHRRRGVAIAGELTLVQRCRSRGGRNDFVTGFAAAGPNVFLDCASEDSTGPSGPLESWASGVLFDNVRIRGNALRLANRGPEDQGAGWSAANSVLWNCEATDVEASSPPDAPNAAIGCKGTLSGNGIVTDRRAVAFRDFFRGLAVEPRSLYLSQLEARLGSAAVERIKFRPIERDGLKAVPDGDLLRDGLKDVPNRNPTSALTVVDGRFMIGSTRAWTKRVSYSWFQGQTVPSLAPTFGPAITRFAPGRDGPGLTDDLEAVVRSMPAGAVFYQHYGLWYDRRRVNHNYDGSAERRTADVWAPFMELPWARSGIGKAWDGLSRYDLTRFNPWYFERLKTFADLCDRNGRVLHYSFYFQHWLLESRAHYVDFPWRPVNARQDTGMPDEVPAANAFWDLSNPVRADLHRRYIRKVLDTLGMNANVVFGLDPEYTGSLSFVRFWLDEIATWQQAHGRRLHIVLEIPKDEMDAVLEDPVRGPLISAIDFHGWVYRPDGRLFAIRGGLDRSIREQRADIASDAEQQELLRRLDPALASNPDFQNSPEFQTLFDRLWASTPALKARAIQEYRLRYPRLVILAGEPSP